MGWKFDEESLRKIYEEEQLDITYEEFRKWAEHFADTLIKKAKKEMKDDEAIEQ